MTRLRWAPAVAVLTACATAPPTASESALPARTLAYGQPAVAGATYALRDSTVAAIQAGSMGNLEIRSNVTATTEISYVQKGASTEATIHLTDFEGVSTNSATGTRATATESEISGAAVVIVSPRGNARIASLPEFSPAVLRAGMNPNFFRWFFIPLPGTAVRPGAVWVDTLRTSDDAGGTLVTSDVVLTSTFARDSIVDGRTLAVITTSSQRNVSITGSSDGVQISQKLIGPGSGWALWDFERGVLVERSESWQLSGTFDLPQMGISGLPISARSGVRLELK